MAIHPTTKIVGFLAITIIKLGKCSYKDVKVLRAA